MKKSIAYYFTEDIVFFAKTFKLIYHFGALDRDDE